MTSSSKYWVFDGVGKRPRTGLKRFKKGSKEAKRYMRKMRGIKSGTIKERRRTYYDGLY